MVDAVKVPGRERRRELDELDTALVAALREDGRAPNVELARIVGTSEKTVRTRIARLISEFGLTITATLPEQGQRSRMVYLLHTEPGSRFEVAEFLAARAEVTRVELTTGSADVLVTASFPDDAAALRFQVQTVEAHPGVRSVSSCHLIGEVGSTGHGAGESGPRVDTEALAALIIGPPRYADFEGLAGSICDAVTKGLGADRAMVVTSPPDLPRTAGNWYARGITERYLNRWQRLVQDRRAQGPIQRVWDTRLHVFVSDARSDPLVADAHDLVRQEGYISLLTLPVLYGASLVATISMYYDRLTALDDEYIATAQGVADHFAVAMARVLGLAPAPPRGSRPAAQGGAT